MCPLPPFLSFVQSWRSLLAVFLLSPCEGSIAMYMGEVGGFQGTVSHPPFIKKSTGVQGLLQQMALGPGLTSKDSHVLSVQSVPVLIPIHATALTGIFSVCPLASVRSICVASCRSPEPEAVRATLWDSGPSVLMDIRVTSSWELLGAVL